MKTEHIYTDSGFLQEELLKGDTRIVDLIDAYVIFVHKLTVYQFKNLLKNIEENPNGYYAYRVIGENESAYNEEETDNGKI